MLEQAITWAIVSNTIHAFAWSMLFVPLVVVWRKFDWFDDEIARGVTMGLSVICSFVGLLGVTSSATTALKAWVAPKIYLIEYAASLAK